MFAYTNRTDNKLLVSMPCLTNTYWQTISFTGWFISEPYPEMRISSLNYSFKGKWVLNYWQDRVCFWQCSSVWAQRALRRAHYNDGLCFLSLIVSHVCERDLTPVSKLTRCQLYSRMFWWGAGVKCTRWEQQFNKPPVLISLGLLRYKPDREHYQHLWVRI